ncbi:molybdenum cofactor guanylyltransferase [Kroppenstedtia pulmonis]|uniref:Molybdenum cofactor guanylyltransferase n=1 Tax=Kroppenstedtia pulmonis TaxID=1380685 RepID=A0A7D4BPE7_9BACL|nr:molybdenum cofactor guanylyltransferase [Kroppenstedtia pulmonis]QKG84031.1 molybdenum cofactor guanylyltransferase [Kroppenstedtia pulmonis]
MGRDKAHLEIEGENMLFRIRELLSGIGDIRIVSRPGLPRYLPGVPVVYDRFLDKGPLAGIHAGLMSSEQDYNLVVACDMPFVSSELAHLLFREAKGVDAVVPEYDGQIHPLFAVYHRRCLPELESFLEKGECRVRSFLREIHTRYIPVEKWVSDMTLFNMNSPADWQKANQISQSAKNPC